MLHFLMRHFERISFAYTNSNNPATKARFPLDDKWRYLTISFGQYFPAPVWMFLSSNIAKSLLNIVKCRVKEENIVTNNPPSSPLPPPKKKKACIFTRIDNSWPWILDLTPLQKSPSPLLGRFQWKAVSVKTYSLVSFFGPSCPKLVFRVQTPRSRHFLKLDNFIRLKLWFYISWGLYCENWS